MALSPREAQALATLEAALRADDPALAAVLGTPPHADDPAQSGELSTPPPLPRTDDPALAAVLGALPPPAPLLPRIPVRHVVHLVAALLVLIVVTALWRDELGTAGTAAAAAVLLLPWLVLTAHATADRPRVPTQRGSGPFVRPPGAFEGILVIGCGVLLAAMTVPPAWAPVVVLVSMLVLVPWLALRVMAWIDRVTPRRTSPTCD